MILWCLFVKCVIWMIMVMVEVICCWIVLGGRFRFVMFIMFFMCVSVLCGVLVCMVVSDFL